MDCYVAHYCLCSLYFLSVRSYVRVVFGLLAPSSSSISVIMWNHPHNRYDTHTCMSRTVVVASCENTARTQSLIMLQLFIHSHPQGYPSPCTSSHKHFIIHSDKVECRLLLIVFSFHFQSKYRPDLLGKFWLVQSKSLHIFEVELHSRTVRKPLVCTLESENGDWTDEDSVRNRAVFSETLHCLKRNVVDLSELVLRLRRARGEHKLPRALDSQSWYLQLLPLQHSNRSVDLLWIYVFIFAGIPQNRQRTLTLGRQDVLLEFRLLL
mmetsp:Transcript_11662/g.21364  ORF Transcript_11662/g.21364 Transcript_11662/m.21364 type:complete len:266 (+) Transcript_11662:63-860(+)